MQHVKVPSDSTMEALLLIKLQNNPESEQHWLDKKVTHNTNHHNAPDVCSNIANQAVKIFQKKQKWKFC